MMKIKSEKLFFILIISSSVLLLWGCSGGKKPVQQTPEIPAQLPAQESSSPPETQSTEEILPVQEEPVDVEQLSKPTLSEQPAEEGRNPEEVLEQALDTYQDALSAWDKGDLDTALAALDDAYSLLLQLRLPSDSPLCQEKDDLRLLIAQRIQEIYASRRPAVSDNNKTIPLVENKHVEAEIKSFQTKERELFEDAYKRSGRYMKMILEEIASQGLPEQLSWIPIIESWFKVRAYSRARALGLWQFISSTGYRFGLKRDRWIDERMDPVKSTKAALQYLSELHDLFGDWTTALAAYNCGEFRVQRAIKNQRLNYLDNFWDLYMMLPRETARFTPRFIAALLIVTNPEKFGFTLPEPDPFLEWETIPINRPVKLSTLSEQLRLDSEELAELNPELRHKSTPDQEYQLKVPSGYRERALAAVESLPRWIPPEATYVIHIVRRGETVSAIAQRYRTSISTIARLNNLRRNYMIWSGQRLKVPTRTGGSSPDSEPRELVQDGETLVYIVKKGDSLYLIARDCNTTIQKIKQDNTLRSDLLSVGQKLTIHTGKPQDATLYTVKSGDTPYLIAKRYGMSLSYFLRLNRLRSSSKIYPGQKLWVTPNNN